MHQCILGPTLPLFLEPLSYQGNLVEKRNPGEPWVETILMMCAADLGTWIEPY